jgi:mono/diheme cytochrome c family protein
MSEPRPARTSEHDDQTEAHERYDVQGLHAPILRERRDPRDGYEPIPPWLAAVFGALIFWGGFYLQKYSGDFRSDIYDEYKPSMLYGSAKPAAQVDPVALGKKLFTGQGCVSCHQATGKGTPGQYPPLAGSEWVQGSPARIARILLNGLQGNIKVAGESFNGNMPAFGAKLKDDQIAAVLTYIRQEWGNKADAIDAATIAAAREAEKSRSNPWTAEELTAITKEDAKPAAEAPKGDDKTKASGDAKAKASGDSKEGSGGDSKAKASGDAKAKTAESAAPKSAEAKKAGGEPEKK